MREQLIKLLRQNARMSDAELAVMLGVSEEAVKAEIQNLEEEGVIKGYSAIVDEELVNKDTVTAVIELRVTPKRDCGYEEIAHTIMQYDQVESVSLMAGAYDLSVTVKGTNVKEISLFVARKLAPLAGVMSTATYFVLKNYKMNGILIEDEEKDERGYYFP